MSKRLVTYFSASGITAKVAENLADAIGADIFEIQPEVPCKSGSCDKNSILCAGCGKSGNAGKAVYHGALHGH